MMVLRHSTVPPQSSASHCKYHSSSKALGTQWAQSSPPADRSPLIELQSLVFCVVDDEEGGRTFVEVARLEGEEQRHVVLQRVFAVDVISLVLQQPARLVHHPIRGVDGDHRLPQVILDMHRDIQLSPLPLRPFTIVFVILSQRLEHYEGSKAAARRDRLYTTLISTATAGLLEACLGLLVAEFVVAKTLRALKLLTPIVSVVLRYRLKAQLRPERGSRRQTCEKECLHRVVGALLADGTKHLTVADGHWQAKAVFHYKRSFILLERVTKHGQATLGEGDVELVFTADDDDCLIVRHMEPKFELLPAPFLPQVHGNRTNQLLGGLRCGSQRRLDGRIAIILEKTKEMKEQYLGVTILILGRLSSRRQAASRTEAFMELSENMWTEVEMVPRVNSANFSCSSWESNSCPVPGDPLIETESEERSVLGGGAGGGRASEVSDRFSLRVLRTTPHNHFIHDRRDLVIAFEGLLGKGVLDRQQTEVSYNDIRGRGGLGQEDDGRFLLLLSLPLCVCLILLWDGGELLLPSLLFSGGRKEVAEEVHGVKKSLRMEMDIQGRKGSKAAASRLPWLPSVMTGGSAQAGYWPGRLSSQIPHPAHPALSLLFLHLKPWTALSSSSLGFLLVILVL
ncbi:hypothetical protein EYF80_027199 [Liparis tanakae]|uniref:Uncharacterized protein n=1 Tax=Liparis tanakae TaxID=230148 RepID=A0A4Z2HAQ3_9TELE|nr:hypothetical protein EYF80_027199 [Liparis tanakae]